MRFLADMGLDVRVVEWLRRHGHDAVHLRDEELQRAPDEQVFAKGRGSDRPHADQRVAARAPVLATAYAAHPERFPGGLPQPPARPTEVWINPPRPDAPASRLAGGRDPSYDETSRHRAGGETSPPHSSSRSP